jgi:hypothetical protein
MLLRSIVSAIATICAPSARRRSSKTASSEGRRAESVERMFSKAELNRGLEALAAYHARRRLVFDRVTGDIIVIQAGEHDRPRLAGGHAREPAAAGWSPSLAAR